MTPDQPQTLAPPDYPAAHSMDSTWWAVDGQGRVAQFETGKGGAMPEQCENVDEMEMFARLAEGRFGELKFNADDLMSQADGQLLVRDFGTPWHEAFALRLPLARFRGAGFGVLLWLRDETVFAPFVLGDLAEGTMPSRLRGRIARLFHAHQTSRPVVRLPAAHKTLGWLPCHREEHLQLYTDLLDRGFALRGWLYCRPLELVRFGLFTYRQQLYSAFPYARAAPPLVPVQIEALPPAVGQLVSKCTLQSVDFVRDALVQPSEHGPTHRTGRWISTTGTLYDDNGEALRETPQDWLDVANEAQSGSNGTLSILFDAWLRNEPHSGGVLNDYLAEAALPPVSNVDGPSARMDEALLRFLTPLELVAVEADLVEHVMGRVDVPTESLSPITEAIGAARQFAAGKATAEELDALAGPCLAQWHPAENAPDDANRVAWSAFALVCRWPLAAARTARTIVPDETAWQVEYAVKLLDGRWSR